MQTTDGVSQQAHVTQTVCLMLFMKVDIDSKEQSDTRVHSHRPPKYRLDLLRVVCTVLRVDLKILALKIKKQNICYQQIIEAKGSYGDHSISLL